MPSETPRRIAAQLPDRATIFELAMMTPDEGWLVGAVFNPDFRTTQSGLILHYQHDHWQPVDDPLPNAFFDGIAMVSPAEGWATGYNPKTGESYLLRYADGQWQPVAPPLQPSDGGYYGGIRMLSPDEGWLVVNPRRSWQGEIARLLLHYQNGTWTPITVPIPTVWDLAPVGPDDLWVIGNASTLDRKDSALAHFQGGRWTTTPAPDHALLHTLRMLSATDGYAIGWQPWPSRWTRHSDPPAVVLHYDGTAWQTTQTGSDPAAQTIVLFDHTDGWAFVQAPLPIPPVRANEVITSAQHKVGERWEDVYWPFSDIIHVSPIVRAAPGEYWAAALYEIPPGAHGDFHWELLHFDHGTWTEYPPR